VRDEVGGEAGVTVGIVTMSSAHEASIFCQGQRLPFQCLADSPRSAYRAYGLRRGTLTEVMGPQTLLPLARAAAKGHFPGVPVGDVYQLGAIFLVGTDGRIRYAHQARHAGDHPPGGELGRVVAQALE
jgi:AhpC/TSA antioxidant enzyme